MQRAVTDSSIKWIDRILSKRGLTTFGENLAE
jgi:hypothetical protein